MSILKLMCEECYEKEYGGLPNICGIPMYELSKKEMECVIFAERKNTMFYIKKEIKALYWFSNNYVLREIFCCA